MSLPVETAPVLLAEADLTKALAASETNTLQLLRDAQHKDVNGIPIGKSCTCI